VGRGDSRALVLRGEAGIGKTALLRHLIDSASDLRVVRAAGVEAEMELPFASLHQVCGPLLDRRKSLPDPQRQALEIVFGERAGPAPDRFLVGLATLSLFSEVADERPLLCVVDDAQWIDRASALTLAFVSRRLLAEPVGIVFAARDPGDELRHLSQLEVRGLTNGDAHALLDSAPTTAMDEAVRGRILAEARGNPLALLELTRTSATTQPGGGAVGITASGEVSGRIEESYVRRLDGLSEETRLLLLVAAAEPVGDPILLWRALETLGTTPARWETGEVDGLLEVGERVIFRHPLVRSAAYRSATPGDRRAVHRALAEATDEGLDPDRRAWHRAAATGGPDEEIAAELELSADRAQARGGAAAAAAFLQRSVALSDDPARRADRALAAARALLGAGSFDAARKLLATAESGSLDELGRARADQLRAEVAFVQNRGSDAPALLLQAARRLESLDVRLARDTYLEAWTAALFSGASAKPGASLLDVSRAAAAAPAADPAVPHDRLLDGLATFFNEGRSAGTPILRDAIGAYAGGEISDEEILRWGFLASRAANFVWDYDSCLEISRRAVEVARASGTLEALPPADNACGQATALGGDFETASMLVAEVVAVKEATGMRIAPHGTIVLAGLRGEEREASQLIGRVIAEATAAGQGTAVQYAHWAYAVLMNGLGRYEEALRAAVEATERHTRELFIASWALVELIEAATRADELELAEAAFARLRESTASNDGDWALGILARCEALMLEGEAAERSHREAIDRLGRTQLRPDLARAHLLCGEFLRRENRRADARTELRTAHGLFESIGMGAFAERARRELHATGEKVRKRVVETREDLTPQEWHIAQLARDGLSNPEIGAQLFLSPRTIEWHLRKVFAKLEIGSRRELRTALADGGRATVPS
jgi:DNA-binding CsgD family transcriptional regulator